MLNNPIKTNIKGWEKHPGVLLLIDQHNWSLLNIEFSFDNFRKHKLFQFFILGYSRIKIEHIADSLLKLQIKIGVHLINVELSELLTLDMTLKA